MAENLGLSGADLTDFIYRQQELHRGESTAEREFERVRIEAAAEAAERELARAHEIRLLELRPPAVNDVSLSDVFAPQVTNV